MSRLMMVVVVTLRPKGLVSSSTQGCKVELISYFQNVVYNILILSVAHFNKIFFCTRKLVMLRCSPVQLPGPEAETGRERGALLRTYSSL